MNKAIEEAVAAIELRANQGVICTNPTMNSFALGVPWIPESNRIVGCKCGWVGKQGNFRTHLVPGTSPVAVLAQILMNSTLANLSGNKWFGIVYGIVEAVGYKVGTGSDRDTYGCSIRSTKPPQFISQHGNNHIEAFANAIKKLMESETDG